MPINVYTVANHLEENGWKLVSTVYKNLTTELEMLCPEGHKQLRTYGDWRKHPYCETCRAGDPYKIKQSHVAPKEENTQRVLALDAATNITGYALFDNGDLIHYGTFKTTADQPTEYRIHEVKEWLTQVIQQWEPSFIGLEAIQLQSFGKGQYQVEMYRVLANLQGVLINTIFENSIDHDLVYVAEWRKYCGISEGVGREFKKKAAQDKVKLWYQQDCNQDEADAICIGKYFCSILKNSKKSWGEDI